MYPDSGYVLDGDSHPAGQDGNTAMNIRLRRDPLKRGLYPDAMRKKLPKMAAYIPDRTFFFHKASRNFKTS
jgi:hypothetical protein